MKIKNVTNEILRTPMVAGQLCMIEVEGLLRFQPFHCCKTNHKIIVQPCLMFEKCQQNHYCLIKIFNC